MSKFDWLDGGDEKEVLPQPVRPGPKQKRKGLATKAKPASIRRPKALVQAERKLKPEQRLYARLLNEYRVVGQAERHMRILGYDYSNATYMKWRRKPDFIRAQQLLADYSFECLGLSKDKVLLDAERIKNEALTPKPILFKGEETGFEEVQLGHALKALEIQGKGVGLTDNERTGEAVTINIDFSGRQDDDEADGKTIEGELA